MNQTPEIFRDRLTQAMFATDASIYQIFPEGVAYPNSIQDVQDLLAFAKKNKLSITCRGGGTSLAGQTIGEGLILDFSRYMNRIIELNIEEQYAIVEPGVIRDQLNREVSEFGLHFAPDPATSSRASIGGMFANNSSGTKSIVYGKTSDNSLSVKVLLANGEIVQFDDLDPEQYDQATKTGDLQGEIHRFLRQQIYQHADEIQSGFPKIMRRVSGYAIDAFVPGESWNLTNLICGSEGTLGIILEIKVKLTPLPKVKMLAVVHFKSRKQAIEQVARTVAFEPAAIEMCDRNVLDQAMKNSQLKPLYDAYISKETDTILIVEFFGCSQKEIIHKMENMRVELNSSQDFLALNMYDDMEDMDKVWSIRKKGLGLLMGRISEAKPIPFVEDSSIPLRFLSSYIEDINQYCTSLDVDIVVYAHASVGVLHVRPILDLKIQEDIEKMKLISEFAFQKVKKYGGSWSGEHGDGRVRSPKLEAFFGEEIYEIFTAIKLLFDPSNIFNPHNKVWAKPMDQNLRYGSKYKDQYFDTVFHYREQADFQSIVHNCSGIGACRNLIGGVMCPSYKATEEELHNTRGRANVLRLAMSGQLDQEGITSPLVAESLSLCLSCKACKTECPSNVDMAKLKSEVLQQFHNKNGIPTRIKLASSLRPLGQIKAGIMAPFVNKLAKTGLFKKLQQKALGITSERTLPAYASRKFRGKNTSRVSFSKGKVGLFGDCYVSFYEKEQGKTTLALLNKLGYEVEFLNIGCCQRPAISNGLLNQAKSKGEKLFEKLRNYPGKIIVLEPSCLSSLSEDLPDLMNDELYDEKLKNNLYSLAEFLIDDIQAIKSLLNVQSPKNVVIHGHCHERALRSSQIIRDLLVGIGYQAKLLDTSCCGMAGTFGYHVETYEASVKIASHSLLPALSIHPDHEIVSTGFSCRHQIQDLADRKAKHWVELIYRDIDK